jgi:hypothetical protein
MVKRLKVLLTTVTCQITTEYHDHQKHEQGDYNEVCCCPLGSKQEANCVRL